MDWIVPLIAAVAAVLGLFLSKPARQSLAVLTAVFILVPAVWQAASERSEQVHEEELERQAVARLLADTNHFMDLISEMLFAAADTGLPSTEEAFFAAESARVICQELNIDRPAPIIPEESWRRFAARRSTEYQKSLETVRRDFAPYIDIDVLRALDRVERSSIALIWGQMALLPQIDEQLSTRRPPLLCWGLDPLLAQSLTDIHRLLTTLRGRANALGVEDHHSWNRFPHQKERQARDRYSVEALEAFRREVPSSNPARVGHGNPNKPE